MDLRSGEIKSLYFKYLASAFGSALISCIYGVVDMAMVGQYEGPGGTAALAVVAPVWNIIYSLGLLTGIGGSVIFSTKKSTAGSGDDPNAYFTAAVVGSVLFAAASWGGLVISGAFILLLPLCFGGSSVWLPMPRTELVTALCAAALMQKYTAAG